MSDLYRIESHGMQPMARCHKSIERGMITKAVTEAARRTGVARI